MAVSQPWKRYLEAGMEATEVPRAKAEKLVKDLVKAGDIQIHEAADWVEDLIARSRKTTESIADRVRVEVQQQLESLGLVEPAKQATKKAAAATKQTAKKAAGATKKTAKKAAGATKKAAGRS